MASVLHRTRYFHDGRVNNFLQAVLAAASHRKKTVRANHVFFRAQLGYDEVGDAYGGAEPAPLRSERMKPLSHSACEGRANPKGITYLYLATDKETALSEVRPWVGQFVSVGQFKTMKDLLLIDCSLEPSLQDIEIYSEEPAPAARERAIWRDIDRAFSEPVHPTDSTAAYVPTQVLAEFFRHNGFDGIFYKSLLGRGYNIALFDLTAAELMNCALYRVTAVSNSTKKPIPTSSKDMTVT